MVSSNPGGARWCVPVLVLSALLVLLVAPRVSAGPSWWQQHTSTTPPPQPAVPTALNLALLQQLAAHPAENQALSPFVMSSLMTQVYLGAGGTTRDEMTPVLGLDDSDSGADPGVLDGYRSAVEYLSSNSTNVTTAVFNRMYVRRGFSVLPSFSSVLYTVFHSEARPITTPEQTANDINSAVAQVTRGRISELVMADQLHGADMVLVSALYFKALWEHPFEADDRPMTFLTADGERPVQMMTLPDINWLPYVNMTEFEAVALPYSDPAFCMLLLRPTQRTMDSAHTLLHMLDSLDLPDIFSRMRDTDMQVTMPRFKLEVDYSLVDAFSALGIHEIFSPGADFSALTDDAGVFVSDIIHKVFIEVTEEGTEAAGAGAAFFTRSMPMQFLLDRPFVAVVYNRPLGLNLFSAYVASPAFDAEAGPDTNLYVESQLPKFLSHLPTLKAARKSFEGSRVREFFPASQPLGNRF